MLKGIRKVTIQTFHHNMNQTLEMNNIDPQLNQTPAVQEDYQFEPRHQHQKMPFKRRTKYMHTMKRMSINDCQGSFNSENSFSSNSHEKYVEKFKDKFLQKVKSNCMRVQNHNKLQDQQIIESKTDILRTNKMCSEKLKLNRTKNINNKKKRFKVSFNKFSDTGNNYQQMIKNLKEKEEEKDKKKKKSRYQGQNNLEKQSSSNLHHIEMEYNICSQDQSQHCQKGLLAYQQKGSIANKIIQTPGLQNCLRIQRQEDQMSMCSQQKLAEKLLNSRNRQKIKLKYSDFNNFKTVLAKQNQRGKFNLSKENLLKKLKCSEKTQFSQQQFENQLYFQKLSDHINEQKLTAKQKCRKKDITINNLMEFNELIDNLQALQEKKQFYFQQSKFKPRKQYATSKTFNIRSLTSKTQKIRLGRKTFHVHKQN